MSCGEGPVVRRTGLAAGLILCSLMMPIAPAKSATFTRACTTPAVPGNAVAIDGRCGLEGSGGDEATGS